MFRAAALIALIATLAPPARAATACFDEADGRSVVAFALPAAVEAAARRCASVLPRTAWLPRNASRLAARYRQEGGGDLKAALPVMERLSGQTLPKFLDDSTAAGLANGIIAERVTSSLRTSDCASVARVAEQLDPLPLGNVAALAVALAQLDDGKLLGASGLSICPLRVAAR